MIIADAIALLQQFSDKNGIIAFDFFTTDDIQHIATSEFNTQLTRTELLRVADDVENGDAEVGMNWESIRYAIEQVVNTRTN